ncbi:unnamed protein product [Orchesella dallaii]|uniref:G patch domain-containing protein 4 n=1 Tax=Orchesella dallaii TaxID=48710 RepID=A0ABP1QE01_9HEXA
MDFARKQLEKFGWKDGTGLGKNEQGILTAIKPTLKVGKEGMGFDLSKELVDTWWTRAYDDSLKRINVDENDGSDTVGVSLQEDEDDGNLQGGGLVKDEERPFIRMKKRMTKATFTTFSKGAILSNGEMITEKSQSEDSNDDSHANDKDPPKSTLKSLTDEELFKACGGRTAHKGARFGLKLSGKLARIAAQEEALKELLVKSQSKEVKVKPDPEEPVHIPEEDVCNSSKKKKDKKKKSKKHQEPDSVPWDNCNQLSEMEVQPELEAENSDTITEESKLSKKKQKKHKKRKYAELQDKEEENATNEVSSDLISETPADSVEVESERMKKKKKSKKHKRSKDNHESSNLISS